MDTQIEPVIEKCLERAEQRQFKDKPELLAQCREIAPLLNERVVIHECHICGDDLIEFKDVDHSCYWCGWQHLVLDDFGDERGIDWIENEYLVSTTGEVGMPVCRGCVDNFSYHPDGSIVLHLPGMETGKFSYISDIIEDISGATGEGLCLGDLPENVLEFVYDIVNGTHYHRVDGWRGSHQPPKSGDGFKEVFGGWHSSMTQTEASDFINQLPEIADNLDIPIAKVFTYGSNICALGVSVYVLEKDFQTIKNMAEGKLRTGVDGHMVLSGD